MQGAHVNSCICQACQTAVDPRDAFCRACGARLAEQVGERRHLSVMFCDLVGSTSLASRMDPEDVLQLLELYRREAGRIIAGHGGHIAQYLGDGLLVYFGYPQAQEDAPVQATAAGLRLAERIAELSEEIQLPALDEPLAVRVGIHSGQVALGPVGEGAGAATLAMGNTVNIASRLAGFAQPGDVVISQELAGRLGSTFELESIGSQFLKGLESPMHLWRAVRSARQNVPVNAWRTPLVGREAQLAELADAFAAAQQGRPQPVLVLGDAGIGKSRLIAAFRKTLANQDHFWITCRGVSLHQDTPFHPLREAMREHAAELPPTLQAMIAAETRTTAQREADQNALADWLIGKSRGRPVVLHCEDLHWFDPSSQEALGALAGKLEDQPILLLAASRPDGPSHGLINARVLHLPPLATDELQRLIAELLGNLPTDAPAVADLARRAEGIPLFAEELARSLLEQTGESDAPPEIPGSLQDLFAARLDRLGPLKGVVQTAALLGRAFDAGMLARVVGQATGDVDAVLGLAIARQILHKRSNGQYQFYHALLQEAAASAMLRRERSAAHRRIADVMVNSENVPAGIVASHFAAAGATGEAIAWYGRAGEQALAKAAYREAEAALAKAVALFEAEPDAVSDVTMLPHYSRLNRVRQLTRGYADPLTVGTAASARELARRSGSLSELFREEERLLQTVLTQGDYLAVTAHANELASLAQAAGRDADMLMIANNAQLQVSYFTGNLAAAEEHFTQFHPLVADIGRRQPPGNVVSGIGVAALVAAAAGHDDLARARIAHASRFADQSGHPYDRAMATHYHIYMLVAQHDREAIIPLAAHQIEWAAEHGFAYLGLLAQAAVAWARGIAGEAEQAGVLASIIEAQIAAGARIAVCRQLHMLAELHLIAGMLPEAAATTQRALTFNPQERLFAPGNRIIAARVAMATNDIDTAVAELGQAHAEAVAMGALADMRCAEALLATMPATFAA